MKKIVLTFLPLLFITVYACNNDDSESTSEVCKDKELIFKQDGGTQTVNIVAASFTVDEAGKTWCSAEITDGKIKVIAAYNPTQIKRETTVKVTQIGQGKPSVIKVVQESLGAVDATAKNIPLGGNCYVSAGTGSGSINDSGITGWSSPSIIFSTFFRVNRSGGDLKLYLKYTSDAKDNVILVKCEGKKFVVSLPKATTETTVFLGRIEKINAAGYIRVDLQGKTRKGSVFATASSLVVSGTSTESINYVGDFSYYWGRRGPSVHMGYTIPGNETAEWFYNEVTVPIGFDPIGSYFMANGFSEGYFGMQVISAKERRILFSVWSPANTDDPNQIAPEDQVLLVRKGAGVNTGEFGDEGSGGQSYLVYNWVAGNTYKFLNRVRPISGNYSEYTAYFYAPETGQWKFIAQWKRPKIQTYYKGHYSFLENFDNTTGHVIRKAYYRNQWVYTTSGRWIELLNGQFTVDATGRPGWRMDYKGGTEGNGFFLQNCGFFNDYVAPDTPFQRDATGTSPVVNWNELE